MIAFRGKGDNSTLTAASLAITPHASTVAGDLMLAVVTVRTGNSLDNAITPPGGWSLIDGGYDAGTPGVRCNTYRKTAGSSEGAASFSFGTSNEACGSILSYSGVNTSSPVHVSAVDVQVAGSTARSTPSISVSESGCWVVSYFADRSGSTWTGPDTERSEVRVPATSASQVVCDSAAAVAAGSVSRSATASASTSVAVNGIIALRPAAAPGAVPPPPGLPRSLRTLLTR
ncbi:hypothetical protein [Actinomadura sp. 21ATH]|uniref:hypothetical protein n=1 Tax=Actinomadura sp. 21ATH TaxID=1735444 RepID=UPI0035BFBF1C